MALRTPPSWQQNSSHPAENDRLSMTGLFRTSGVLLASDLAVTQSVVPALSVSVAAGWGVILGTTQANMGSYQFTNDLAATATITTADVTNPRIDLICVTVRDAYYPATGVNNDVIINVVPGTPAASPAVPATPANSLVLAQVAVAANATSITNASITDLRQVVTAANVAQSVAGKNVIINSANDFWNRGITGTANAASAGAGYNADRFQNYQAASAITVSRQATADTTNLAFIQYCARVQRNAAQTATSSLFHTQSVETSNSTLLAGKTATYSFYARAGANYSPTSNILVSRVDTGTGTDQNVLAGLTGAVSLGVQNNTLTTIWQRFTATISVPSNATQVAFLAYANTTGTAGTNDYFEITGIQLELGSTPTAFSRSGGSIGGETVLVQRYYSTLKTIVEAITLFQGISYPVTMRANPTVAGGGAGFTVSAADVGVGLWYQTTRAQQSLTLSAEL